MSTALTTRTKETVRRFCDAMNTGNKEVISKTIDALVGAGGGDPHAAAHRSDRSPGTEGGVHEASSDLRRP